MLFSPLRDTGTRGAYNRFKAGFGLKLYRILFRKGSRRDLHTATDHTTTMPSSDSPSTAETAQPEAAAVPAPSRSNSKGNQAPNTSESTAGKEGKQLKGSGKPTAKAQESTPPAAVELTPAQLKKKAKEEKAARRAQAVSKKDVEIVSVHAESTAAGPSAVAPSTPLGSQQKGETSKGVKSQQRTAGPVAASRNLPNRVAQKVVAAPTLPVVPKKEDKTVEFFRHLYRQRTTTLAGAGKDIHPAILALGLQMGNYTVCGSCARLVAMLHAFKSVSSCDVLVRLGTFT